jgi:hypothetical protein
MTKIKELSDSAVADAVHIFGLVDRELSDEDKAYGEALTRECLQRFADRGVWLGQGISSVPRRVR